MPLLEVMLAVAGIGCFGAASVCALICLLRQHTSERGELCVPLLLAFVLFSMVGAHLVAHSVQGSVQIGSVPR